VTSAALWLVRRELAARARRVALAGAVVATIAAAVTATELVARGREAAVAAQIDLVGPALTVVPRGTTASALARYDIAGELPSWTESAIRGALERDLRGIEKRIVVHREVAGAHFPIVGVFPSAGSDAALDEAAVGSELARRVDVGSRVTVFGREFEVVRVLPSTGSIEDAALFVPFGAARGLGGVEGVNELRVFLAAGVSAHEAEGRVARALPGATVVRTDRGEVADAALQESLARHRGVAYAVMAAVAALTLLLAAHLDATERRTELATLVAVGAARWTILGALLVRSATVAGLGAAVGALAGLLIAAAQESSMCAVGPSTFALAAVVASAGAVVGMVAAVPTAFACAARDPVRELQES
jgi:hypothetical protein